MDMSSSTMNMPPTATITPSAPSGGMDMSMMAMTFFSAQNTSLFSSSFTPTSSGAYAATCIFLIVLATIYRGLLASKTILENRWRAKAWKRRYIVVADKLPISERNQSETSLKPAVLSENGVEENVRIIQRPNISGVQPWRFSVDLPRAVLATIIGGVGYLLMLAVMTFNIGYFFSVLGGIFVGEVMVGRYIIGMDEHH